MSPGFLDRLEAAVASDSPEAEAHRLLAELPRDGDGTVELRLAAADLETFVRRAAGNARAARARIARQLEVRRATHSISRIRDPALIMDRLAAEARRSLSADLTYIATRTTPGTFTVRHVAGVALTDLVGTSFPSGTGLAAEVARTGRAVQVFDYQSSERFPHGAEADLLARQEGVTSVLAVPAMLPSGLGGIVVAVQRTPTRFSPADVEMALVIAVHAASCLETAALLVEQRERAEDLSRANTELARHSRLLAAEAAWTTRMIGVVADGGGVRDVLATLTEGGRTAALVPAEDGATEVAGPDVAEPAELREIAAAGEPGPVGGRAGSSVLVRRVEAAGRHLGTVVLLSPEPPGDEAEMVVRRALPVLALTLSAHRAAANDRWLERGALLRAALRSGPGDRTSAGLDAEGEYLVLDCRLDRRGSAAPPPVRLAAALPATTSSFDDGDDLVVVCPVADRERAISALRRTEGGADIVIGIDGPVHGTTAELRSAWHAARRTAAGLLALGAAGAIADARELGPLALLLTAAENTDAVAQSRAALRPIERLPARRATDLRDTMLEFLRQNQNMQRSAEALHVHVNTLYQRLASIDQLFGPSWRTPERSLGLRLALEVTKLARDAEPPPNGASSAGRE
ncbi:helix-turn-helix domain-containing protein [Amycolatopsis sp. NPDC047767]|uniref:helix-turn-helix domain-containing protein n=1 Tax=Amycolatopsis sp. NPDC047767 TaxID=3156765 RepID=UPI0034518549